MFYAGLSAAQEIRVSAATSLQPYSPAFEEVLRLAGFSPKVSFYPGARSFKMLAGGEVDAEFTRTKTAIDSIKESVTLVGPIGCLEGVAFTRRESPIKVSGLTDLQSYKVGIPFTHRTALEYAKQKNLNVDVVTKRESAYEMLNVGRFDLVVDARLDGLTALKLQKLEGKIAETGPVLFAEPVYFVVNNLHREWAPRIQDAFDVAIRKGSWQEAIGAANVANGIPKNLGLTCLNS